MPERQRQWALVAESADGAPAARRGCVGDAAAMERPQAQLPWGLCSAVIL